MKRNAPGCARVFFCKKHAEVAQADMYYQREKERERKKIYIYTCIYDNRWVVRIKVMKNLSN